MQWIGQAIATAYKVPIFLPIGHEHRQKDPWKKQVEGLS